VVLLFHVRTWSGTRYLGPRVLERDSGPGLQRVGLGPTGDTTRYKAFIEHRYTIIMIGPSFLNHVVAPTLVLFSTRYVLALYSLYTLPTHVWLLLVGSVVGPT